jgi:hypothetical protein
MIVAIMVSFVVMLLSVFIVQLSIHNGNQSAYDRRRIQSIAAAEAGIDATWRKIEGTAPDSMPCASPFTGTLASSPGSSAFTVQVTYYDATGTQLSCPLSQTNVPSAALLTSTGTTNGSTTRKMQAYATLTPVRTGLSAAIMSNSGTTLSNSFTLNGNSGSDADIYVNSGNLSITNTPQVFGNIYVPNGSFSMSNNTAVSGNVWANLSATLNNTSRVTGDVTSSTSSIAGVGFIGGNATAGTTVATTTLHITGSTYQSTMQGPPPSLAFPYVCWTAVSPVCSAQSSNWTSAGYTVQNFADCASAYTYLTTGTIAGDNVVRINATCNLAIGTNDVINFSGNLAIFTNGSITMANQNNWNGVSGKNLFFLVNYQSTSMNCASGNYNISSGNNSNFNNVNVSFYSPCTITIQNQNNFSGQLIGGTVNTANNFTMNFRPVLIPGGAEQITGFQQNVVYLREVA